jgi:hypothetical protein
MLLEVAAVVAVVVLQPTLLVQTEHMEAVVVVQTI